MRTINYTKTTISGSNGFSGKGSLKKYLLFCGIIASVLFVSIDIFAGTLWKGYSFISQSISELTAVGSPTRLLVLLLDIACNILMTAFGFSVWSIANQNRFLRTTAVLLVGYSVINLVGAFFPMDLEVVSNNTNPLNVILTGVSMLFLLLAIGFGAAAYRNWFRFYSIGTLLTFLLLTFLGLLVVPQIATGTPTSRVGIQERIMLYGYLLWVVVLTIVCLREEKE